ncbi:MAG: hypothetical protein WB797_15900 [Nocardioides sp.]
MARHPGWTFQAFTSSNRKVATIIDRLAAVSTANRSIIGTTYANNNSTGLIDAAQTALFAALASASLATRAAFSGRSGLAGRCAVAAVGLTPSSGGRSNLNFGVAAGTHAVLAKEAGLIGATFTTTHYDRMTNPIEQVITMPSGY